MKIKDIKKSIFLNLMAFSSYLGLLFVYLQLYSHCVIYSGILPAFLLINIIGFAIEVHRDKLFFCIPDRIVDNPIFTIIFYLGLIFSVNFLCAFLLFSIDCFYN